MRKDGAMLDTPILFIVFNRLDTARRVFERIREARPRILFVAADGPRSTAPGEAEKCEALRAFIAGAVDWDCDLRTRFLEENRGCKLAVSGALQWFFSEVERGIVLEDDCLPKPEFFRFCEELLERYADDPRIRMISGRNNLGRYRDGGESYRFTTGAGIWGWATWAREMRTFDVSEPFPDRELVFRQLAKFTRDRRESEYLAAETVKMKESGYSTWDFQWSIQGKLKGQITITPSVNMIENIGFGSDATHTTGGGRDEASTETRMEFPLRHPSRLRIDYGLSRRLAERYLPRRSGLVESAASMARIAVRRIYKGLGLRS
jgi:hypothetical protein